MLWYVAMILCHQGVYIHRYQNFIRCSIENIKTMERIG